MTLLKNNKEELISNWNVGWTCLMDALNSLTEVDLNTIIYIRNEGHTITEAINRQLCHYSYHIGQIVFIGKLNKSTTCNLQIASPDSYRDSP